MVALKMNSFFSGAGGIDIGFIQAGFTVLGAYDFNEPARKSYTTNIGEHFHCIDIKEVHGQDIKGSFLWTFGFPCQDLSKNGKMAGMVVKCESCGKEFEKTKENPDCGCGSGTYRAVTRSGMFYEIMRLLKETENKPPLIMAENVPGLKRYLDVMEEEYRMAGYKMKKAFYNSKYWEGVPQNRERYFVIGVRDDIDIDFTFPVQGNEIKTKLMDILEDVVDEKYFIDVDKHRLFMKVGDTFEVEVEKDGEVVTEIRTVEIAPELVAKRPDKDFTKGDFYAIRIATKRGYDFAFPGDSVNISHPKSDTRRGRVGQGVAQTLLTSNEQVTILPDGRVRRFTPREIARLQGFPDSFSQVVSDTQFIKQVGNAVSVPVAKAIAEKVIDFAIEYIGQKMIKTGMEKGLSHEETVKISQELDQIHNIKMKLHQD